MTIDVVNLSIFNSNTPRKILVFGALYKAWQRQCWAPARLVNDYIYIHVYIYIYIYDYEIMTRKYFPRYWPFVRGFHQWPMGFPHKGHGFFSFDVRLGRLLKNSRVSGDLRRYESHEASLYCHHDISRMYSPQYSIWQDSYSIVLASTKQPGVERRYGAGCRHVFPAANRLPSGIIQSS